MNALALTDHGNLYGALEFYKKAKAAGINPIIGYEAYIAPGSRFQKDAGGMKEASYHLTLLAQNRTGFQNLIKLASPAFLEGFYFKPRIDKELLAAHSEGIDLPERLRLGRVQPHAAAAAAARAATGTRPCEIAGLVSQRLRRSLLHRNPEQRPGNPAAGAWRGRSRSPAGWACRWWPRATPITSIAKTPKPRTCCCASTPASSAPTRTGCGWKGTSSFCAARQEMYAAFPGLRRGRRTQSQEIADSGRHRARAGQAALSQLTRCRPDKTAARLSARAVPRGARRSATPTIPSGCADGELAPVVIERLERELDVINKLGFAELLSDRLGLRPLSPASSDIPATARGSGVGSLVCLCAVSEPRLPAEVRPAVRAVPGRKPARKRPISTSTSARIAAARSSTTSRRSTARRTSPRSARSARWRRGRRFATSAARWAADSARRRDRGDGARRAAHHAATRRSSKAPI